MDIMRELKPIGELYKAGKHADGLVEIRRLWDAIPAPKHEDPNMQAGDLNGAWEWALLGPGCIGVSQDLGEAEFLLGKVAYERGDPEAAKSNFLLAKKKSHGRIFLGEDKKYEALIRA